MPSLSIKFTGPSEDLESLLQALTAARNGDPRLAGNYLESAIGSPGLKVTTSGVELLDRTVEQVEDELRTAIMDGKIETARELVVERDKLRDALNKAVGKRRKRS